MKEDIKLCKDCKFFLEQPASKPVCSRLILATDLVYGIKHYDTCSKARTYVSICGPEGKYFQSKTTKPVGPNNQVIKSLWSNIKQSLKAK